MNRSGREDRGREVADLCRPRRRPALRYLPFLPAALLLWAGCAHDRRSLDPQLLAGLAAADHGAGVADAYRVAFPDVLEVAVAGRPDLGCRAAVEVDGCATLGALGRPRVQGQSVAQITRLIADEGELPAEDVTVRVAAYNSQKVYLFGQVNNLQRALPYRGPETVLELLQRGGGITARAAPDDVWVVRPHVAEGTRPEVFHIELRAIVLDRDPRTNLRLQPFDQVYVGETRQAKLERCLPPLLQPTYQRLAVQQAGGSGLK